MNKLKINLLSLPIVLAICFGWVPSVHAGVNDFVINRFDAEYGLTKSDAQGTLAVNELIDVTFNDQNHGILRALPNTYKNHRLQLQVEGVSSGTGASGDWSTYQSGGNTVIKIGDPNRTVTGHQTYAIQYTIKNVIGFYPDHDELYWDLNGDQWEQPVTIATSILSLPKDLQLSNDKPICYTGDFDSKKHDCTIKYNSAGLSVITKTTKPLQPHQTLSLVAGFKKGYFQPPTMYETIAEYSNYIIGFFVPLLLIGGAAGLYWFKRGRDAKGKGTIVAQYDAPDGLRPIEVGDILDFKTDNRDITATIIDLAIRGYIKIIETTKKRKLLKDSKSYALELRKTDFSKLHTFESKILNGIFDNKAAGAVVDISDLTFKLSSVATSLRVEVGQSMKDKGYISQKSSSLGFLLLIISVYLASFVLVVFYHVPAVLGIVAGTILMCIFLAFLPSRTAKGVQAKEHILGLKMYLEVAEKDRIKLMQSPDAHYAEVGAAPKRTVHLFEELLPYAMVLGVEKQWATKFNNIYKTKPDWYSGNINTFSAVYLASSLSSGMQPMVNTAFSSPASSSSSGFSGGGAGGGGGGGGGGGW